MKKGVRLHNRTGKDEVAVVDSVLIGIVISEGVGFIFALIRVSYHAGKVLQWMKQADYRIERLEVSSHTHNPGKGLKTGGEVKDYAKKGRIHG